MNPSQLGELIAPLAIALLLLAAIQFAARRRVAPRRPTPDSRHVLRGFAKKGAPTAVIARSARVPQDIVNLALYVEQRRAPRRRAAGGA
jgi:hypothetical protein